MSMATEMVFGSVSSKPFQYSEEEQKTNLKWIDGKEIYCKTFKHTVSSTSNNYVPNSLLQSTYKLIAYEGIAINKSSNSHFSIPYTSLTGDTSYRAYYSTTNGITISQSVNNPVEYIITIYYTK